MPRPRSIGPRGLAPAPLLLPPLAACVAVLLAACGKPGAGAAAGSGLSISDSAGVTIVRFGSLNSLRVPTRATSVSVEVGRRPGTELFRVSTGRLLGSGTLAFGDRGSAKIVYVDSAGDVARRVGDEGEGPGEFRDITSMPQVRVDTLTVYDFLLGRLTVLGPEGNVVDTRRLPGPNNKLPPMAVAMGGAASVLALSHVEHGTRVGMQRDTALLVLIHPPSSADTIGLWPGAEWANASIGGGYVGTQVAFGPSLDISGRGGRAVLGSTDRLVVTEVGLDGSKLLRIEGTAPSRPVTDSELKRWRTDRLSKASHPMPAAYRKLIESTPAFPTHPVFSGLMLDADGRVWIGAPAPVGAAERPWTAFGPHGKPRFRVVLPDSARPLDAAGDRLVVLEHTKLEVEVVRVLRLGAEHSDAATSAKRGR